MQPVVEEGEELLLIHFVDQPARTTENPDVPADRTRVAELEHELDSTREELQGAVRSLELAGDEQKAINDNALSVNEESNRPMRNCSPPKRSCNPSTKS